MQETGGPHSYIVLDLRGDILNLQLGGCRKHGVVGERRFKVPLRHPQLFPLREIKAACGVLFFNPPVAGKTLMIRVRPQFRGWRSVSERLKNRSAFRRTLNLSVPTSRQWNIVYEEEPYSA